MVVIKLFSPRELVIGYYKSFGITNELALQKMADEFLKTRVQLTEAEKLFEALDEKSYKTAVSILGHTRLSKSEFIGYFKMLCLSLGTNEINFFETMPPETLKKIREQFSALNLNGTQTLNPSKMVPQKIKVYKPLLPLKKRIKHLFKRGGRHVRK